MNTVVLATLLLSCSSAVGFVVAPASTRRGSRSRPLSTARMTTAMHMLSRREVSSSLVAVAAAALVFSGPLPASAEDSAKSSQNLDFKTAGPVGFSYADVKIGTGSPPEKGQRVAIDYVMSTTGARYGTKIDSTVDRKEPYAWSLGDGTTIAGLELAIAGGDGVPPMKPGGVRRVIIPSNPETNLGYSDLAKPFKNSLQMQECSPQGGRGPVPPNVAQKSGDMGAGEFQRFKNIYCNANRPYQPDLVMDVRLFGKKALQ